MYDIIKKHMDLYTDRSSGDAMAEALDRKRAGVAGI